MKLNELINESLSVRSYNCLSRAGVTDLEQLSKWTTAELKNVRNLGTKHYSEILDLCHSKGIHLKDERQIEYTDVKKVIDNSPRVKSFENIMRDRDIIAALDFCIMRASTIQQNQLLYMVEEEIKKERAAKDEPRRF